MKLSDYLLPQDAAILSGKSKADALRELIAMLARQNQIDPAQVEQAVWAREKLMSTGIGQGLAIPHVRLAGLKQPRIAIGVSPDGLADYDSLDGEPIRIVVLILAPQGQHETHIRLLAQVAEVLKDRDVCRRIIECGDPEEIYRMLVGK